MWVINSLNEKRMAQDITPEERQSLERTLSNVTEEFTALREMYPNVPISTLTEAPNMPNKQENTMGVFPQIYASPNIPVSTTYQNPQESTNPDSVPQDHIAQEESIPSQKLQDQLYADLQESWNRGVHNVRQYVKDPHVSIEKVI